ncbi:hypothetical protein [Pseudomonas syringae]|uniref:hypothetical protein n=1 Tax=Pseudomonas syringae TaxID=317 RepID=UPI000345EBBB|nr:hypothetical protein [Pseudomonas syringae]MDG6387429.1 hypothetical protein [Pseudomonas syringae]
MNINGILNQANTLQQAALIPGTKNGDPTEDAGLEKAIASEAKKTDEHVLYEYPRCQDSCRLSGFS